jgi:hypothetical protein
MPLIIGMPGIGLEMEGAMQQAPQPLRQFMPEHIGWPPGFCSAPHKTPAGDLSRAAPYNS